MSPRTTRVLSLGLAGSAVLLTLFTSCSTEPDPKDPANAENRSSTTHSTHHGYRSYRRSYWSGWGSSYGGTYVGHTTSRPSGSSATGRSSSSSATSRGGFGGSGHVSGG